MKSLIIFDDLPTLKAACESLGYKWLEGQKQYKWFGRFVGDYPLPEGITADELGKCDHAVKIPGAKYEVGIVKKGDKWIILYDFWQEGKLEPILGRDAQPISKAYGLEKAKRAAKAAGMMYKEKLKKNGDTVLEFFKPGNSQKVNATFSGKEVEIEAVGYKGKACLSSTKFLEEAFGKELNRKLKGEYYIHEESRVKQKQKNKD